jgi:glycosyltransferase involved in cell wall biosynthesis
MKLLFITYSYSPDLNPRAFRLSAIAAFLVRRGHEVDVLCAALPGAGVEDADGVTVYRVGDWLLNGSARVVPGARTSRLESSGCSGFSMRLTLWRFLRKIWRAVYWPDFACGWVIPATRVARALGRANHYDWVISVSHPFSSHMVAMAAKQYLPRSRWFVDISDPYSDRRGISSNNSTLYSKLNRVVESRILAAANIISVTTNPTKALYETNFPSSKGKYFVIPPLLSLPDSDCQLFKSDDALIRLVFIGTLYKNLRSPKFLLACFLALSKRFPNQQFELNFYGLVNDCSDDFSKNIKTPNGRVQVHGLVSREEVLRAMFRANILVNIGNHSEVQLGSKVLEYMAMGKPIINLISLEQDLSVEAFADYPSKITIFRSENEPSSEIIEELGKFVLNPPPVGIQAVDLIRARFSKERISEVYALLLESRFHPR